MLSKTGARCPVGARKGNLHCQQQLVTAHTGTPTHSCTRTLAQSLSHSKQQARSQHICHAQWLENSATVEVPVPLETAFKLWDDREKIPNWMPWIKSVKVLENDVRLSRWTLSTNQFGRDWEFSWLARNLPPIKNTKIHWVSEPGTSLPGVSIMNRGQIKFARSNPTSCAVTLIISYEVPDGLAPFANLLTPLVEGILRADMERFRAVAVAVK